MYGEKKDPGLRLYADRGLINQLSILNSNPILKNTGTIHHTPTCRLTVLSYP